MNETNCERCDLEPATLLLEEGDVGEAVCKSCLQYDIVFFSLADCEE